MQRASEIEDWVQKLPKRHPRLRFVAWLFFGAQALRLIIGTAGRMLDAYQHAQFYIAHRDAIIRSFETALEDVFSSTGSIVTLFICSAYLVWDNRIRKHVATPAPHQAPPDRAIFPNTSMADQAAITLPPIVIRPKAERIKTNITPLDLMKMARGRMTGEANRLIQPHIGKWMTVTGRVDDVIIDDSQEVFPSMGLVRLPEHSISVFGGILLTFDADSIDRISILQKDEIITALGQLRKADSHHVELEHCELVQQ